MFRYLIAIWVPPHTLSHTFIIMCLRSAGIISLVDLNIIICLVLQSSVEGLEPRT